MRLSKKQLKLFKELTEMNGISGQENEIAYYLQGEYQALGYPVIKDNLGSIFSYKKSNNPHALKVMVAAHMDEVGFIVIKINDNGTIHGHGIGGLNEQTLLSSRVIMKGRFGNIYGTIDATSPHLLTPENKDKVPSVNEIFFDFGFTSVEEATKAGVYLGAMMVMEGTFLILNDGKRLLGKAFDDRVGLIMGLEILEKLRNIELPYDLYIGGTVQEEVGCRGAITASHVIKPDLAIVIDCSPSRDTDPRKVDLGRLGEGVLIRVADNNMIAFKELTSWQISCAEKSRCKYQYFTSPGGTDAGAIHKNLSGIPTLTHCLCARNIHTNSTILDVSDYFYAKKSLEYMLMNLDQKVFDIIKRGGK